jgi:hypothetical protein
MVPTTIGVLNLKKDTFTDLKRHALLFENFHLLYQAGGDVLASLPENIRIDYEFLREQGIVIDVTNSVPVVDGARFDRENDYKITNLFQTVAGMMPNTSGHTFDSDLMVRTYAALLSVHHDTTNIPIIDAPLPEDESLSTS